MEGKKYVVLKTGFLRLVLFVVFHAAESKWVPVPVPVISGPLCTSQFTLVNHACAFLPYTPTPHRRSPPAQPQAETQASGGNDHRRRRRHHQQNGGHGGHGHGGHGHGGHGHGGHGNGGHGNGGHGGRGRRSREGRNGRHRRRHRESAVQQDCCRWLKEVDDECVCDLLVHLPPFLSRPLHQYSVMVDDTCNVTFQCGSRLKA